MPAPPRRVPTPVKVAYTAFLCVLVPKYTWDYGPTNFLYFCDLALFAALVSVWCEAPLWASAASVGILVPQAVWMADLIAAAAGRPLIGVTAYMFDDAIPLFTRGLSFFHFWLPLFLLYLLWRLGYDRRGLAVWTAVAWLLLPVCYYWLPPPPPPADNPNLPVNVNYVYGFGATAPQQWMSPGAWLGLLLVGLPIAIYWPTHVALRRICRAPAALPTAPAAAAEAA